MASTAGETLPKFPVLCFNNHIRNNGHHMYMYYVQRSAWAESLAHECCHGDGLSVPFLKQETTDRKACTWWWLVMFLRKAANDRGLASRRHLAFVFFVFSYLIGCIFIILFVCRATGSFLLCCARSTHTRSVGSYHLPASSYGVWNYYYGNASFIWWVCNIYILYVWCMRFSLSYMYDVKLLHEEPRAEYLTPRAADNQWVPWRGCLKFSPWPACYLYTCIALFSCWNEGQQISTCIDWLMADVITDWQRDLHERFGTAACHGIIAAIIASSVALPPSIPVTLNTILVYDTLLLQYSSLRWRWRRKHRRKHYY